MEDMLKTNDVRELCEMINNFGGINIVGIDVSPVCNWADYFIISSFSSLKQIEALYSDVMLKFLKQKQIESDFSNKEFSSDWTLISFKNIVIHLMNEKARGYYELEKIWDKGEFIYP